MNGATVNISAAPMSATEIKRAVIQFTRGASTEISTHDEGLLTALLNKLPPGTTIYVAHSPLASLDDVVRVALEVESLGFRASPHIVARRLGSDRALRAALRELRDGGVEQVLLVGGNCEPLVGKFSSTADVLATGYLVEEGFERIGVCGHPEGHKAIGPTALWQALRYKQAFAQRAGLKMHIVTQFGFSPEAVCAWDRGLNERGVLLPVHVGIAGPTSLPKLIKFAMQCGVGNSLHALMHNISAMSNFARVVISPDEMLEGLVRGRATYQASRLVQPHFYSFGGAVATAHWLRAVVDGTFEVQSDGGKFLMNA
jgi:methylenetetrahydrofolate reductase (NADPH)